MCGRCPEQPVTHAWAAGQFSQRGWPFQGSGPGSTAGMGGQRLPRRWEKSVLEGSLGPRQQELSLECPPASPYMYGVHPVKGRSQEGTKARCHPGPWGHCLWLDLQSGPKGASRGSVCFGDRALDTGRKAYFWRQDLGARAQMPHPVPPLTRAGKAVSSAWLEGRQDWPLVAGRSGGWLVWGDHTGTVVTAWGGRAGAGASPLLPSGVPPRPLWRGALCPTEHTTCQPLLFLMTQPSPSSREGHEMLRGRPFQSPTRGAGGSQGLRSPAKARVSALGAHTCVHQVAFLIQRFSEKCCFRCSRLPGVPPHPQKSGAEELGLSWG